MSEFWKRYKWWLIAGAAIVVVAVTITVVASQQADKTPVAPIATLTPTFNVKDYGAKGDGKTLDEAAILKTIAAAKGAIVYFPAGNYLVKASFKLPRLALVKGDTNINTQSYLLVITPLADGSLTWKFRWIKP